MDALLEALGLERRPPETRFFEDLFLRFQRRIATETLTRPAGDPETFDAEAFFGNWIDEERGLVGEERARAFTWLARQLGFACELESSFCFRPWETVERDEQRRSHGAGGFSAKGIGLESHRAVVAAVAGRRILADAGFPTARAAAARRERPGVSDGLRNVDGEEPPAARTSESSCDARGEEAELLRLQPRTP